MAARISRGLFAARCTLRPRVHLSTLSPAHRAFTRCNVVQVSSQRAYWASPARFVGHSRETSERPIVNPQEPNVSVVGWEGDELTSQHWANQDLPIVDRPLEPQTVGHFVECMMHGTLPNATQTTFPLMTPEEVRLLVVPVNEWTPAPSNASSTSFLYQVMSRIGSYEDPSRLCAVGKNIHSLKSRLWEGLVPVSAARWAAKDLNNPKHFDAACEYLTGVIAVFEYLNLPPIRDNLRDTFNLISGHWKDAELAFNARRAEQDQPLLNLAGAREEFMRAKYEVITGCAHSWLLSRVRELQQPLLREIVQVPMPAEDEPAPAMDRVTEQWNHLWTITLAADLQIWMPMAGYHGHQPSSQVVAGLQNPDLESYFENYLNRWEAITVPRIQQAIQQNPGADPSERARHFSIGAAAQDELRLEIRGLPAPSPPEPWIQLILRRQAHFSQLPLEKRAHHGFGLAIYRMPDKLSDPDWAAFKHKLEEHLSAWGDGVQGAEEVKPLLKLHWFDGKALGFAKRDLDAAKSKLDTNVFLAIDRWTVTSYTNRKLQSPELMLPGDFQGNVLAVDASFDPEAPNEHAEESPGFDGKMRILGSMVWSELYPMLILQCASLEDMWPLAMEHLERVYTGPTVPSQRSEWLMHNELMTYMLQGFSNSLREKDPGIADKVEKHLKSLGFSFREFAGISIESPLGCV